MNDATETIARRKIPSWVPQACGWLISAVCLIWVLRDYDPRLIVAAIKDLDWKWIPLVIVADLVVYVCHGWRWQTLLSPVERVPFWRSVQSIYIGLFANELLPLRTGEVIRCYLLAHWSKLQLTVVIASIGIERLIDGIYMIGAFWITSRYVKGIPGPLLRVVDGMGVLLVLGVLLFAFIVNRKHHAHSLVSEHRYAAMLWHMIEGLHLMGSTWNVIKTCAISFLYLALQILTVYWLMKAAKLDYSIFVAAGVLAIVRFATVIPNAPGNIGVLQAGAYVALRLFEADEDVAKSFSFIMFFALTLPLLIGGTLALALTGLNLGEVHKNARKSVQEQQGAPAPDTL
jgi:uncharacterized protein (TIRG00374 family)